MVVIQKNFNLMKTNRVLVCPPDNIPYRGGKAEGGHGGDCLASSPDNLCQFKAFLNSLNFIKCEQL